jgi:hypothetical protein
MFLSLFKLLSFSLAHLVQSNRRERQSSSSISLAGLKSVSQVICFQLLFRCSQRSAALFSFLTSYVCSFLWPSLLSGSSGCAPAKTVSVEFPSNGSRSVQSPSTSQIFPPSTTSHTRPSIKSCFTTRWASGG